MPDLTSIDTQVLADELESRHWIVFHPKVKTSILLSYIDDESLLGEIDARGLLPECNEFKNFLWDLYYDAILLTPEQFFKALNRIFVEHLNKWI